MQTSGSVAARALEAGWTVQGYSLPVVSHSRWCGVLHSLGTEGLVGLWPEDTSVWVLEAIRTWLQVVGGVHPVAERYMLLAVRCHLMEPASREIQHLPCTLTPWEVSSS